MRVILSRIYEHVKGREEWRKYAVSSQVSVKAIEERKRILIEWSGYGTPNLVEWIFTAREDDTTFVSIC